MRRSVYAVLASLLAATIFAGVNLAAWRWLAPARIDFTQNGLYTLSTSAKRVVERLVEPIELELVYSRGPGAGLPAIRAHADRVRELLREIAAQSSGKIRISETDPEPFSEEEDRIVEAGLAPAPLEGDPVYFGVIGRNSVDDIIAIPFLAPERDALLEYDLARLIAQLDDPAPPKVAVISSLPAFQGDGSGEGDAFILREIRRAFTVLPVAPDFQALPNGTDILLAVHPGALSEWQTYVVDQFLLRKGRALIALDPVSRAALASGAPRIEAASGLGRLGNVLGASLGAQVAADRVLALPVEVDLGAGRTVVEGQPLFPAVPRALMSSEDPVTADLSRAINFGAPGHLIAAPPPGADFAPLVETTTQAALIPAELAMEDPAPRAVMQAYTPANAPLILAARLSGELRSAFATPPPVPVQQDPALADLEAAERSRVEPFVSRSQTPAEVFLLADSDMLDDAFFLNPANQSPMADNAAFILNALDNLSGDEALMALRSRAPAARPMERVDALRASARERLYKEQQRLEALLADAEGRLAAMEQASGVAPGTPGQIDEIARFREEAAGIRRQLRSVEREFRRDIDALAGRLEFINIWLPPIFVGLIAAGVFVWRSRPRTAAARPGDGGGAA